MCFGEKKSPSGMKLASSVHGAYYSMLKYASGSFSVPGIAALTLWNSHLGCKVNYVPIALEAGDMGECISSWMK